MRIAVAFIISGLVAIAVLARWYSGDRVVTPERIKAPSMAIAKLAGTTASLLSLDFDWKRSGEGAIAKFSVQNLNDFQVTSFEIACHLFDKDAKSIGKLAHKVRSNLAANAKASLDEVRFLKVEPLSRTAICYVNDALPRVSR